MITGLFKRFAYPLAYFCTTGLSSDQLYPLVWEAIGVVESCDLDVLAVVCDGASPNRRFFKMHQMENCENVSCDGVVYWTYNSFDLSRKVYFFSDPPHLIKTIRTNLENSGGHNNTRNLVLNGKMLSWLQVVELYNSDIGANRATFGLRKLHRLTHEHIYLNPSLRMRVYLAAQVLSKSVPDRLKQRKLEHTSELENFIHMTDQFFDMLNVSNVLQGKTSLKNELHPFRKSDDWRFGWLENVYNKNDWKKQVDETEGLSNDMKSRRCLAAQTIEGIRITVRSFIEMVPMILDKWKHKGLYVLSDKLNQDCVEEHFGRIRMRGGANENPSAKDFGLMNRRILVIKSDLLKVFRGNTRGRIRAESEIDIEDDRTLAKRAKLGK